MSERISDEKLELYKSFSDDAKGLIGDELIGAVEAERSRVAELESENAALKEEAQRAHDMFAGAMADIRTMEAELAETEMLLNEYKDAECKAVKREGLALADRDSWRRVAERLEREKQSAESRLEAAETHNQILAEAKRGYLAVRERVSGLPCYLTWKGYTDSDGEPETCAMQHRDKWRYCPVCKSADELQAALQKEQGNE
jgi:chromosome segregation ATPase